MTGKQSRLRVYLYLFAYVVLTAAPAAAQTQDDLFNDAELHDVMLTLSDRDWSDLKAHPEENTNYTADLRWRGPVPGSPPGSTPLPESPRGLGPGVQWPAWHAAIVGLQTECERQFLTGFRGQISRPSQPRLRK